MRVVLQRVADSRVEVEGRTVASIGRGLLALVGVERGDGETAAEELARRVVRLRIFDDEAGKMNRSLADVRGELLVVSQFTLCADLGRGRRPSFDGAAPPAAAAPLVERFAGTARAEGVAVATGRFGASMRVFLTNDGPATFVLESRPAVLDKDGVGEEIAPRLPPNASPRE